ncbi:MAG: AMP-binding protein [Candidatus Nomurabacteria bacterium]|jgi:long-chain acyl-CoA synthetase|nr:AMP-binding protein [Candidatus Nomurabacteria bacterium]
MTKKIPAPWYRFYGRRRKTIKYPNGSMYDEVRNAAEKCPENIAYDYFGNKVNFTVFLAQIDRAAHSLLSLGVKKGDVISLCSPNIPEAIIALYAINKLGAVANIFHPLSAPNEIRDNLNLVGSTIFIVADVSWKNTEPILHETNVEQTIVISPADSLPLFSYLGYKILKVNELRKTLHQIITRNKKTMSWDEFVARGKYVVGEAYEKTAAEQTAIVLYSGGTTGKSKGIALSNRNFNALAYELRDFIDGIVKIQGKVMLGIMPVFHGFGLGVGIHTALANGAGVALFPKFDVNKFDKILASARPNFIIGVPALYQAMLNNKKVGKMDLSFIDAAFSGGDTVSANLRRDINDMFSRQGSKARLLEGYGLTECLTVACVNPVNREKDGSIGIPLADTYFKIVEPKTYTTKPVGEIGEIVISGPILMEGYINNDVETNQTLHKHPDGRVWLHTGDIGKMDQDGYIFFTGRIKRLIISSGYNIYPDEIERTIMRAPEVLLATVVGVPDRVRGQVAKAFIVLRNGLKPSKEIEDSIMELCKKELTKYKWPRKIEFRTSLPKTKVGKVAYNELTNEQLGDEQKPKKFRLRRK